MPVGCVTLSDTFVFDQAPKHTCSNCTDNSFAKKNNTIRRIPEIEMIEMHMNKKTLTAFVLTNYSVLFFSHKQQRIRIIYTIPNIIQINAIALEYIVSLYIWQIV